MPPRARQQDEANTPAADEAVTMADVAALTVAPTADEAVTMADVAALTVAPTADEGKAPARPAPFMSEGMRHDLETVGWAVDPSSGARFELDRDTGDVTVIERTSDV